MKILIFILVCIVPITIMNALIRKVLGVEKKKIFFSNNHFFNDFHRYGEWAIILVFLIINLSLTASVVNNSSDSIHQLIVFALLAAGISLAVFRAIFEKIYAENPKDYLYTLSEMGVAIIIIVVSMRLLFPEYLF